MVQALSHSDIINPDKQSTWIKQFYRMLQDVNNKAVSGKSKPGYFCLSKLNHYWDGRNRKRSCMKKYYSRNLIRLLGRHIYRNGQSVQHDWFVTPNTFIKRSSKAGWQITPKWKFNNIHTLTSFYLDFDVAKSYGNHWSMKPFLHELPVILRLTGISYTWIICSGNGFHVYIVLNHGIIVNNTVMVSLWHDIQEQIIERVGSVCKRIFGKWIIDPKVSNANRILRVVGSFNMKRKMTEFVHIDGVNPSYRPDFWSIKRLMLGGRIIHNKTAKVHHIKHNHNKIKQFQHYKVYKHNRAGNNARTLNKDRCDDIWQHVKTERQKYDHGNTDPCLISGHRDQTLFDFITSAVWTFKSNNKVANELIEMNKTFPKPLNKPDVDKLINELPYYQSIVHSKCGGRYHPTNEQIIRNLNITKQEQKHMKTLIDSDEAKRRYEQRLLKRKRKRRLATQKRKAPRNIAIIKLHRSGISNKQIARIIKCSVPTVSKVIKGGLNNPYVKYVICNIYEQYEQSLKTYYLDLTEDFVVGFSGLVNIKLEDRISFKYVCLLHDSRGQFIDQQKFRLELYLNTKRRRLFSDG